MNTLPLKLRKNGFNYTQVVRGSRSLIYRQEVSPGLHYFEVFLIKIKPEKEIFGKKIPEREIFPGDESFGSWTFRDLESAKWRFEELEKGLTNKDFTFPNTNRKKYG